MPAENPRILPKITNYSPTNLKQHLHWPDSPQQPRKATQRSARTHSVLHRTIKSYNRSSSRQTGLQDWCHGDTRLEPFQNANLSLPPKPVGWQKVWARRLHLNQADWEKRPKNASHKSRNHSTTAYSSRATRRRKRATNWLTQTPIALFQIKVWADSLQ